MHIKIAGNYVFFKAIESLRFDEGSLELVVRTMSGCEHRKAVSGAEKAEELIAEIIERIAVLESV